MQNAIESRDFKAIAARDRKLNRTRWPTLLVALFISAIWLVPFYYLAISVFKTTPEYSLNHPLSLPEGVAPFVENVMSAWNQAKMGTGLLNSTLYGVLGAGMAVFFAAMAAYRLTRIDFCFLPLSVSRFRCFCLKTISTDCQGRWMRPPGWTVLASSRFSGTSYCRIVSAP